jgi:hypothetical protein
MGDGKSDVCLAAKGELKRLTTSKTAVLLAVRILGQSCHPLDGRRR